MHDERNFTVQVSQLHVVAGFLFPKFSTIILSMVGEKLNSVLQFTTEAYI